MNTKWIILAIAAACGLAAQTRMNAEVPFAFEFQGKKLAAGSYEITRSSAPDLITVRNSKTGIALLSMAIATDRNQGTTAGLIFEKTGENYFLLKVIDPRVGTTYSVPKGRKQSESNLFIAAR